MRRKEKGTALIMAMVLVVMIAGMSVALLNLGMTRSRATDFRMDEFRTFQIAQSAVARARAIIDGQEYTEGDSFDDLLTQVSFGDDFIDDRDASGEPFAAGTVSAGEYFATVTKLSGNLYRIRAGGRRPGRVEHMEFVAGVEEMVRVTPPSLNSTTNPFTTRNGAAKSKGDLNMTGGTTDSYNSDDGAYDPSFAGSEGHVGSNTNVIIGGTDGETPTVNGNASAGGTVTVLGGAEVTGTSTDGVAPEDMPSVKDMGPDFLVTNDNNAAIPIGANLDGNNNHSLPPGTYYLGDVEVKSGYTLTIQTPCRVYVSGSFKVKPPDGAIVIDTSNDPSGDGAELYLAKGGTIKGATGTSTTDPLTPSDFRIYAHKTLTNDPIIFQTPHVDAVACVYAPDAPITLKANVKICGSFVGNTVDVSSAQTEIHYDTALAGVSVEVEPPPDPPTPTWVISLWDDTDPALVWRQIPVVRPPVAEEVE